MLEFYSRKQTKVCRSIFSAELASVDDGVSHSLLMQGMVNEVMHGPFRAEELEWLIIPVGFLFDFNLRRTIRDCSQPWGKRN